MVGKIKKQRSKFIDAREAYRIGICAITLCKFFVRNSITLYKPFM